MKFRIKTQNIKDFSCSEDIIECDSWDVALKNACHIKLDYEILILIEFVPDTCFKTLEEINRLENKIRQKYEGMVKRRVHPNIRLRRTLKYRKKIDELQSKYVLNSGAFMIQKNCLLETFVS